MKTLVVYYSKTGNTRTVAEKVVEKLQCDCDELQYDEAAKTVKSSRDPAEYERVILLTPVWAFSCSEPMKLYLQGKGKKIAKYSLIVTYSLFGLRGCVSNCVKAVGKAPETSQKIKAKDIKAGSYEINAV